jgi:hypothetical protein
MITHFYSGSAGYIATSTCIEIAVNPSEESCYAMQYEPGLLQNTQDE